MLTDIELADQAIEVTSPTPASTHALGEALGRRLWPGAVLALRGPLGAGKTLLTQGIGRGLGLEAPIQSPTFILIAEHPLPGGGPSDAGGRPSAGHGPSALYHADLYRLDDPGEIFALGLNDALWSDGVTVIEWADRLPPDSLPPARLSVELQPAGSARRIRLEPHRERYQRLVREAVEELAV